MKKALVAVCLLVVALIVLSGCNQNTARIGYNPEKGKIASAKIRYFDGTTDTVRLKDWSYHNGGIVILTTEEGRQVSVGANNVILIVESEEQYNCVE